MHTRAHPTASRHLYNIMHKITFTCTHPAHAPRHIHVSHTHCVCTPGTYTGHSASLAHSHVSHTMYVHWAQLATSMHSPQCTHTYPYSECVHVQQTIRPSIQEPALGLVLLPGCCVSLSSPSPTHIRRIKMYLGI